MVRRDELGDRAAGVVADQQHVAEVVLLEQAGDEAREAGRREVGAGGTGTSWEPSGSVGASTSTSVAERGHDLAPQAVVGEQPVQEDDGGHAGRRR